jgi:integrase
MGYRPDAIEAQLAHADTNNVRRTYNHATYLDEREVMMQEWADKLDGGYTLTLVLMLRKQ